jgi:hypothetical protein
MEKRRYGTNPMAETRAASHDKVDKKKRYGQITRILKGRKGMTAKEIAVAMYKKGYTPTDERNFSAPLLTEMCADGSVEPVGKKLCEYTGKKVTVYALRV